VIGTVSYLVDGFYAYAGDGLKRLGKFPDPDSAMRAVEERAG
jgi:hypothetical protein